MGPLSLLVFQGTPFCNIDCNYCYLPDRLDKSRMSFDVISKTLDRIIEANIAHKEFTILWHAGEPMVLPISFYKKAFKITKEKIPASVKVTQNIQTNLTLINQEWCDFIKDYNIVLGTSIDGPAFLHDQNRVNRKNKGTFSQVMKGVELLRKNNIDLKVITVLTKNSALFPDELFHFYKEIGISRIGFNIDEIEAVNTTSSYSMNEESEEIIYNFFERFFELHSLHNKPFEIREFETLKAKLVLSPISNLDTYEPEPDNILLTPFSVLTVGTKGDFSSFCPELLNYTNTKKYGSIILGNVFDTSLKDCINTDKFKIIYNDIRAGVEACRNNCEYFGICQTGSPSNKLGEKGSFAVDETMYCRLAIQVPTDVILRNALKEISNNKNIASLSL
jgi:uncharacterized protein